MSGNIEIITRFEHALRAADQAMTDEICDPGLVNRNPAGVDGGKRDRPRPPCAMRLTRQEGVD